MRRTGGFLRREDFSGPMGTDPPARLGIRTHQYVAKDHQMTVGRFFTTVGY